MLESEIKKLTTAITELTAGIDLIVGSKSGSAPSTQGTTPDTAPAEVQILAPTPERAKVPTTPVTATEVTAAIENEKELDPAKIPTKKQLVEKFIELAQEKDREVAVKLLADFGVSKLPELTDKSKWADFIVAVDALLA